MALPPISSSNISVSNQQQVERPRDEQELEQANQAANANAQVQQQDNQTAVQPVEEATETDRAENDTRLAQQQATQQNDNENSAETNLGSQIDITV